MSSTIRVSKAAKRALETLRRRWEQAEGRPMTQEEVAGRAFEILARQPGLAGHSPKWTDGQWALVAGLDVSDPAVSSQDLDEVLYGAKP